MQPLSIIPDGDAGLQVKLQKLAGMVETARRDPSLIATARRLVAHVPERDYRGEIAAVSKFVRRMRYTRDPVGVELFTDPRTLVRQLADGQAAFGDCDDATALGAALFEAIGHKTRFRVGGLGGGEWAHIWLEVLRPDGSGWTAVDDTNKTRPPGWDPGRKFPVTKSEASTMGNGGLCYGGGMRRGSIALGDLDGFSLKKLAKKAKKLVGPILKAPMKPLRTVAWLGRKVPGLGHVAEQIAQVEDKFRAKIGKIQKSKLVANVVNVVPVYGQVASAGLRIGQTITKAKANAKAAERAMAEARPPGIIGGGIGDQVYTTMPTLPGQPLTDPQGNIVLATPPQNTLVPGLPGGGGGTMDFFNWGSGGGGGGGGGGALSLLQQPQYPGEPQSPPPKLLPVLIVAGAGLAGYLLFAKRRRRR